MSILRLTIVLEEVTPRVSRTLLVPADLRLDRLHLVLQAAMGWENQHLYSFAAGGLRWSLPDPHLGLDALPANKATLAEALAAAGSTPLRYTYDFGNNWRHRLTATPTDGPAPGQIYPVLLEAEGRCPPEDVGGPSGYQRFLRAIANPRHRDHQEMVEWYGEPFNPAVPDTAKHRREVLKLANRWQPRKPL
jgi:hypothetical protein